MSPSEYQELTTFFVDQLGRHHRETRAFVVEQLELYRQEMRAFVVEQLELYRQEIRALVVEQLGLFRQEMRTFVVEQLELFRQEIRALVIEQSRDTRAFAGVSVESLRHEIRLVADGVLTNSRLIEEANRRIASVETTMSTRFTDHEDRLRVLE